MKIKKLNDSERSVYLEAFEETQNRIDKFRLSLLYPQLRGYLSDRDSEYFDKLEQAFRLAFKNKIASEAISIIENSIIGAERRDYALKIYKDMLRLYDFMDLNLDLENRLYYLRQRKLANMATEMAETVQDFDFVSKIEERAAKSIGIHQPQDDFEDESLPKLLIITSGNHVFEKQKRGELPTIADIIQDDEEVEDGE
jgi:hypothetical protein